MHGIDFLYVVTYFLAASFSTEMKDNGDEGSTVRNVSWFFCHWRRRNESTRQPRRPSFSSSLKLFWPGRSCRASSLLAASLGVVVVFAVVVVVVVVVDSLPSFLSLFGVWSFLDRNGLALFQFLPSGCCPDGTLCLFFFGNSCLILDTFSFPTPQYQIDAKGGSFVSRPLWMFVFVRYCKNHIHHRVILTTYTTASS